MTHHLQFIIQLVEESHPVRYEVREGTTTYAPEWMTQVEAEERLEKEAWAYLAKGGEHWVASGKEGVTIAPSEHEDEEWSGTIGTNPIVLSVEVVGGKEVIALTLYKEIMATVTREGQVSIKKGRVETYEAHYLWETLSRILSYTPGGKTCCEK